MFGEKLYMSNINESSKGYILGIVANILFGFSFYFTRTVLDIVNNQVFTVLSLRFTIGLLGIIILYKFKVIKLEYKGKDIKSLGILCLFQPVLYFILETFGIKYTSTSEVGIMISMIPVITGVMASIFLNEKLNFKQITCIVISVLGVVIINLQSTSGESSSMIGRIMVFSAVMCSGVYNMYARKLSKNQFTPIEITAAMQLVGSITFTSISIGDQAINGNIKEYFMSLYNMEIVIPILYLGAGCSLLGMFLSNYSKYKLEATKSSILSNIATVVSIFVGVFLLDEKFDIYGVTGSIIIIASIVGMVLSSKDKSKLNEKEVECIN